MFKFVLIFFKNFKNIKFIKVDLTKDTKKITNKFDLIYYCAGYGQPGKFLKNKLSTFILHSKTIIDLKNNLNPKGKFIFMSSSEIYSGNDGKCDENSLGKTNTDHARSSYIESKRFAESLVLSIFPNFLIYRVSLLYGPGARLDDERFLNEIIIKSISMEKIIAKSKSLQLRRNLYVDDALNLIFTSTVNSHNEIFNLSGNSKTTIYSMLKLISRITNKNLEFLNHNDNSAPKNIDISNIKIKKRFSYFKFVSLNNGIIKTIKWYRMLYETNGVN